MGQDQVVPHEAEGDQFDLGLPGRDRGSSSRDSQIAEPDEVGIKGALLGEQLPEHLLGAVIEDHASLDDAGHGVDHGDGGMGGTEEAERAHGDGLFERTNSAMCSGVQMEFPSFGSSEDSENLGGCTLTPIRTRRW